MNHLRALFYKFLMITAVLAIVLGFVYGVSFGDILTISAILTLGAYLLGDLFILPRMGNLAATLADFGLAFFGIWLLGNIYIEEIIRLGVASFLSALLITVGEIFFHSYMVRNVLNEPNQNRNTVDYRNPSFQTEMAEEDYPEVNAQQHKGKND